MKIGIDISQVVYGGGVGEYLSHLIQDILKKDTKNEYILFGASLRGRSRFENIKKELSAPNVTFKIVSIPPRLLDILWNRDFIFTRLRMSLEM